MSLPEKKKPSTMPISNTLPYDLLLSCVARVSRLYYPTLSLVSKSFRSLLASPELYKARSLLGHTNNYLYVCLKLYPSSNPSWFTLCRKGEETLTNALVKIPIPKSPFAQCSNLVAVGSNIYKIGGSTSVSVLDCRSYTWHEAPSLRVKLTSPSASVLDGKIYVSGYREDGGLYTLDNTLEVFEFDTKTQMWNPLPNPNSETKDNFFNKNVCFDGKLHVISNKGVVSYNSEEGRWDVVGPCRLNYSTCLDEHCCEIENVLYSVLQGTMIIWYNTEVKKWKILEGMEGLPKFPLYACIRLVDCGGKMVVMWDQDLYGSNKTMIWCAEIVLEKHEKYGMWGKVEWFDHVLTVPTSYKFVKGLAATV